MFGMSPSPGCSSTPRHRSAPVPPGAEGAVAPSVVWKVCAVLPLVLLVVLMSVKVADGFGNDDSKDASSAQEPAVDPTTPPDTTASETPLTEEEKDAEIKSGGPKPSELPDEDIETTTGTTIPDSGFGIPPGPVDQTATSAPSPTKKPTKKPSPTSSPSPTPTPEEAREQCIANGVNALNIAALAACIADMMDPS
jgi:hypothetical protein